MTETTRVFSDVKGGKDMGHASGAASRPARSRRLRGRWRLRPAAVTLFVALLMVPLGGRVYASGAMVQSAAEESADAPAVADDVAVATGQGRPVVIDVMSATGWAVGVPVPPKHGAVVISDDGKQLTYTPHGTFPGRLVDDPHEPGIDSFVYELEDEGTGLRTQGTVTVTVYNVPPEAVPVTMHVAPDGPSALDLLSHARGGYAGSVLKLTWVGSAHGDGVTLAGGEIEIVAAGRDVTYRPPADWDGTPDSFVYEVIDDTSGLTATGAVKLLRSAVSAGGDLVAPDIYSDYPWNYPYITIDVLARVQGGTGEITITGFDSRGIRGDIVYGPDNKTLRYMPDGRIYGHYDDDVRCQDVLPLEKCDELIGPDQFTYTVTDEMGQTATGTVYMQVFDSHAIIAADDSAETAKGVPVRIYALRNDSDTWGHSLQFVDVTVVSPAGATVALGEEGGDWYIEFTPPPGFAGTATIKYRIRDSCEEDEAEATVRITVRDDPPDEEPPPRDLPPPPPPPDEPPPAEEPPPAAEPPPSAPPPADATVTPEPPQSAPAPALPFTGGTYAWHAGVGVALIIGGLRALAADARRRRRAWVQHLRL